MQIQPYLSFDGRCEEAIEYYRGALGAQVETLMRWKECPMPNEGARPPDDKVMHARLRIGDAIVMASDGRSTGHPKFEGITLSLNVANDDEAKRKFPALAEGGQVQQPLTQTFFSSSFGMLTDRFGVPWMVVVMQ